jgi:hypothetical protein
MPMQTWRQTLMNTIADGPTITAAAEAALVPDLNLNGGFLYPGALLKYTMFGRISTAITTPGTWTWKLRWGGAAGVSLLTTAAITPDVTAASTTVAWYFEGYVNCRSVGTSGTAMSWGKMWMNDLEDATATSLAAQLGTFVFPDTAVVSTIDTTINKALTATITPSVATGSIICHHAFVESLT